MSDAPNLEEVLEALRLEVRRQGKAAIGAQSAAEACLDLLQDRGDEPASHVEGGPWLRELMPFADALGRVCEQAERLAERRAWPWSKKAEVQQLAEGLRLLEAQWTGALNSCGVEIERPRVGQTFDAERHRAVGTATGPRERITKVVRPGYRQGEQLVREADVIVGDGA